MGEENFIIIREEETTQGLARELVTWGSWIRDIKTDDEAVKILEIGPRMYVLVHKGRYLVHEDSLIKIYIFENIVRDDKDIPCNDADNPCYNSHFSCAGLNESNAIAQNELRNISVSYPRKTPPADLLEIRENGNIFICDIKRRTECYKVQQQDGISCCRVVNGNLSNSFEGKYTVNLSIADTCGQDLL